MYLKYTIIKKLKVETEVQFYSGVNFLMKSMDSLFMNYEFFIGGGNKLMTTAERWKRKKDPKLAQEDEEKSKQITKLTELADHLLTQTGNMNIYEENYEQIKKKVHINQFDNF